MAVWPRPTLVWSVSGLSPDYRLYGVQRSKFDIFNINPAEVQQKDESYPKDQQQRWAIARQARDNFRAIQTSKKLRAIVLGAPKQVTEEERIIGNYYWFRRVLEADGNWRLGQLTASIGGSNCPSW